VHPGPPLIACGRGGVRGGCAYPPLTHIQSMHAGFSFSYTYISLLLRQPLSIKKSYAGAIHSPVEGGWNSNSLPPYHSQSRAEQYLYCIHFVQSKTEAFINRNKLNLFFTTYLGERKCNVYDSSLYADLFMPANL
jgi:hypothetical protein